MTLDTGVGSGGQSNEYNIIVPIMEDGRADNKDVRNDNSNNNS